MLALPSIALPVSPESSLLPGGLPSGLKLVTPTGLSRPDAAAAGDDERGRVGGGAAERCGLRLIDQAATPTAARTSTITTLMTARAAAERLAGGLRPPPALRVRVRGTASGGGYGWVDPSGW